MLPFFLRTLFFVFLACVGASAMAYDLYLTRHFEKQTHSQDPELTAKGKWRAKQLVSMLENAAIQKIYSTEYKRTQQSVEPLAKHLDMQIETYSGNELEKLASQIKAERVNVLVVGHSNTTPALISLLGGKAKQMSEEDFGELFKLQIEDEVVETSSAVVGVNE